MSSIPYNAENGNEISNSVTNFMNKFQVGKLLFKCNAGKTKGIHRQLYSETAEVHAKSIGVRFSGCLSAIL